MRNNTLLTFLIIFLVIYTGLILFLAKNTVTWEDEIYSLHTTSSDLYFTIKQSYNFEGQPPIYFCLLNLWRNISHSLFFARVLSINFILLSSIIIYKICRIYSNQDTSIFTTILFLLNPTLIGWALDVRVYSFVVFLSASSIYLYSKAYLTDKPSKRFIILHTVISILAVFTQYLFVLLLFAQACNLFLTNSLKKFGGFLRIHLFIALIFSINFFYISNQIAGSSNIPGIDLEYVKNFFRTLLDFLFAYQLSPIKIYILRGITLLYLIWLFIFIKKQKFSFNTIYKILNPVFFLIIFTFVVFFCIILIFTACQLDYYNRYMAIIFPSIILIFLFSLTIYNRKYFLLWFILLFVYYTYINIETYSKLVKTLDYEKIAEFVMNNEKSDTPILFYRSSHAFPFQYYFKGNNQIIQLPSTIDLNILSPYDFLIKDTITLNKFFGENHKTKDEYIFITDEVDILFGQSLNHEMIDSYLCKNFYNKLDTIVIGRSKKYGLRVRKLTRRE